MTRRPAVELAAVDPALEADPQAAACRRLWAAVIAQALTDAASASAHNLRPEDRAEARAWLSTPTPGRAAILDAANLAPDVFDRPDVRARLRAEWAAADAALAVKLDNPIGRKRIAVVAPTGERFPAIKAAARALGLTQSLVRARALAGRDGWSIAA